MTKIKILTITIAFVLLHAMQGNAQCTGCDVNLSGSGDVYLSASDVACVQSGQTYSGELFFNDNGGTLCIEDGGTFTGQFSEKDGIFERSNKLPNTVTINNYGEISMTDPFEIEGNGPTINNYSTGSFTMTAGTWDPGFVEGGTINNWGSFVVDAKWYFSSFDLTFVNESDAYLYVETWETASGTTVDLDNKTDALIEINYFDQIQGTWTIDSWDTIHVFTDWDLSQTDLTYTGYNCSDLIVDDCLCWTQGGAIQGSVKLTVGSLHFLQGGNKLTTDCEVNVGCDAVFEQVSDVTLKKGINVGCDLDITQGTDFTLSGCVDVDGDLTTTQATITSGDNCAGFCVEGFSSSTQTDWGSGDSLDFCDEGQPSGGWDDWSQGNDYTDSKCICAACADECDAISLLAVTFLSLDLSHSNGKVSIRWQTTSEKNNSHFTIERTKDGVVFDTVAIVWGSGTTNTLTTYVATDDAPLQGTSYYRIRHTDYNGNHEATHLEAINITDFNEKLTTFPNPARQGDHMLIKLSDISSQQVITVRVVDVIGRVVINTTASNSNQGDIVIDLADIKTLPQGSYTVIATDGLNAYRDKLIVQ